ncbi:MAG: PspC domain-containing protein [Crocinitomicaceae bacterium]
MNKTISINIAGFVFNIEEQAFEKLNRYLDSIKTNFKNEEDCDDIMADIEARIAELFHEKISDRKEVIIESDIQDIMDIMGAPEDYVSEDSAESFNATDEAEFVEAEDVNESEKVHFSNKRRLYRDEKNGSVGGVCTGLGWFFGIDPILVKIAFILLVILGGSGILLYIILWIVIPEAKTTAEILEMQGEPVTLDSIKDHVKGMKTGVKEGAKSTKANFKKAVDSGVKASSQLAASLSKIIGIAFTIGGVFALLVLTIILFGDTGILPLVGSEQIEDLPTLLGIIYPDGRSSLVFFAIILVTLIPIISIIVTGVKLLFSVKTKFKKMAITGTIIWFLAVGTLVLTGIELGMNFRNEVDIDYEVPVQVDSTNVLTIDVAEDDIFSNFIEYNNVWNYSELLKVEEKNVHLGYPELRIVDKADSSDFNVVLYKSSNGLYHKEAIHKAEQIKYDISTTNNKLVLAPYFTIDKEERLRNQRVIVEIQVPIGKKVKFGKNIDRILVEVEDDYYRYNEIFANTTWTVSSDGFRCTECKEERRRYDSFD